MDNGGVLRLVLQLRRAEADLNGLALGGLQLLAVLGEGDVHGIENLAVDFLSVVHGLLHVEQLDLLCFHDGALGEGAVLGIDGNGQLFIDLQFFSDDGIGHHRERRSIGGELGAVGQGDNAAIRIALAADGGLDLQRILVVALGGRVEVVPLRANRALILPQIALDRGAAYGDGEGRHGAHIGGDILGLGRDRSLLHGQSGGVGDGGVAVLVGDDAAVLISVAGGIDGDLQLGGIVAGGGRGGIIPAHALFGRILPLVAQAVADGFDRKYGLGAVGGSDVLGLHRDFHGGRLGLLLDGSGLFDGGGLLSGRLLDGSGFLDGGRLLSGSGLLGGSGFFLGHGRRAGHGFFLVCASRGGKRRSRHDGQQHGQHQRQRDQFSQSGFHVRILLLPYIRSSKPAFSRLKVHRSIDTNTIP